MEFRTVFQCDDSIFPAVTVITGCLRKSQLGFGFGSLILVDRNPMDL